MLLLTVLGGVYKHTALKDLRVALTYQYKVNYLVQVRDVDESVKDMYFKDMGLFFDKNTVAGSVEKVTSAPAASGKEGAYDVTLHVAASGSRLSQVSYGSYQIDQPEPYTFLSRFITFEGYITEVNEE